LDYLKRNTGSRNVRVPPLVAAFALKILIKNGLGFGKK